MNLIIESDNEGIYAEHHDLIMSDAIASHYNMQFISKTAALLLRVCIKVIKIQ